MGAEKVNTAISAATAAKLRSVNGDLHNEFMNVVKAVNQLDSGWDGQASAFAISSFRAFQSVYPDKRFSALKLASDFLSSSVTTGYEQTEQVNKSLADQFK